MLTLMYLKREIASCSVIVAQSDICDLMDCSTSGSSAYGILQQEKRVISLQQMKDQMSPKDKEFYKKKKSRLCVK